MIWLKITSYNELKYSGKYTHSMLGLPDTYTHHLMLCPEALCIAKLGWVIRIMFCPCQTGFIHTIKYVGLTKILHWIM